MWSNPKYRRAVIGLIIGVMLGVVLSRVLPYLLGTLKSIEFRNVAQHTDQLVERYPFASASVLAIIFGALFALPEQIKGLILLPTRLFRPAHVLELLFTDESEIHLIIPYMAQREFARIDNNQRIQLPDNAPFLPATHGIAIGRLEAHVREVFKGKKRIRISYDQFPPSNLKDHNFLTLGGPFVNRIGSRLLAAYRNSLLSGFKITDDPFGEDENDHFKYELERGSLNTDFGFIIVLPSHLNPEKRICFIFGLWPQGTLSAMEALIEPQHPRHLARRFRRVVSRGESVLAVVKVEITGLADGTSLFVKVRPLSASRAPASRTNCI